MFIRRLAAHSRRFAAPGFVLILALLLGACSTLPRIPFTRAEQEIARVPGFPEIRFWADAPREDLRRVIDRSRLAEAIRNEGRFDVLAISGGAYDGAFGAGVLAGWSAAGKRPNFTVVTGVSAGALIAPLAFLGPAYDEHLHEAFTGNLPQVLGDAGIFSLLGSADMRRETLASVVSRFVTRRLLAAIAAEHRKGRRLLVLTTNLDAQRGVIWDMGAIAASGHPDALRLFTDVLIASSSIPGLFAPTLIEVEANGRRFNEMHIDGGATTQVFVVPESLLAEGSFERRKRKAPATIWIIVNNHLTPEFKVVENGVLATAGRSFSTLIKTHARFTLLATREYAQRRGIAFNLTSIDPDFKAPAEPGFNGAYMRAVFEHGFQRAASGRLWSQAVPLPSSESHIAAGMGLQ